MSFDICIIGAGPAGSLVGALLGREGFKVAIFEQKNIDKCWSSLSKNITFQDSLNFLKKFDIEETDEDIFDYIEGVSLLDFSGKIISEISIRLIRINRDEISSKIKDYLKEYVTIIDRSRVVKVDLPEEKTDLIKIKTSGGNNYECSLLIDASGTLSNIRYNISKRIAHYWRTTQKMFSVETIFKINNSHKLFKDKNHLTLIFDNRIASELILGYSLDSSINLSIRDSLVSVARPRPINRALFFTKINSIKGRLYQQGTIVHPSYYPFLNLVYRGIILVGESAFQANPLVSSGIYESLLAANIAYLAIRKLDLMYTPSIEDLWEYNFQYFHIAGKYLISFYVLKMLLQRMSNSDKYDLLSILPTKVSKDVNSLKTDAIFSLIKLTKSRIFWRLYDLGNLIRQIIKRTEDYPKNPKKFNSWKEEMEKILKRVQFIL